MPRTSKGPRLWKRPERRKNGKIISRSVWIIKDGGKHIATGCLAGKAEKRPPDAAEQALASYIANKYKPPTKARDIDIIDIADVLSIYHTAKRDEFEFEEQAKKFDGRIGRLNDHFGGTMLGGMNTALCKDYAKKRGSDGGARRDLEDLRAAINHHAKENLHHAVVHVWLPSKGEARERWLTRKEAASLIWTCWRYREVQTVSRGKRKGEKVVTEKRPLRHIARFILLAVYSGTRAASIASASPERKEGRSFVDLERGVYFRRAQGKRKTNKRQPPVPLPARMLAHMRRWHRMEIIRTHFVEFNGLPVKSVKTGLKRAVELAKLSTEQGRVTAHTFRHTAATWLMQRGADPWQAAGFLGMSVKVLLDTYGHHHPDYMKEAAEAITRKEKKNVLVVETVVDLSRRRQKMQEKP